MPRSQTANTERTPLRERLSGLQAQVAGFLAAGGAILERHSALGLLVVLFCVVCPGLIRARYTGFTCDEVYTLRIAQLPTFHDILTVSRRIDLHPPLHYLLERAALTLPFPRWFSARLPSLLATLGTFILCFSFIRRAIPGGTGKLAAFIASALLWFTPAFPFAWLNRPYALWLFFLAFTAVCWLRARNLEAPKASTLWTLATFLAASAMVLDYMAGTICVLPFALAEILPVRRGAPPRKPHWLLLAALLLPCAAGILYMRQVSDFATNSFSPFYLDWSGTTLVIYAELAIPAAVLAAATGAAWLLARNRTTQAPTSPSNQQPVPRNAAIGLLCLPIVFAILAALRHTQFFTRYGACGAIGIALLAGLLAPTVTRHLRIVAVLTCLALVIAAALRTQDAFFEPTGPWRAEAIQGVHGPTLAELDPTQPIVVARAPGFVEMNERESPDILRRTFYLYDRAAAERYSGSTVFETISTTADLLHFQDTAASLAPFLAQHHSFYLIANYNHAEDWLPRYLMATGAHLRYLGKFASSYEDDDLYFVTIP